MSQLFASQIQLVVGVAGTYSQCPKGGSNTKRPPTDESTNKTQHTHMQWKVKVKVKPLSRVRLFATRGL